MGAWKGGNIHTSPLFVQLPLPFLTNSVLLKKYDEFRSIKFASSMVRDGEKNGKSVLYTFICLRLQRHMKLENYLRNLTCN